MLRFAPAVLVALALAGCGGGGGDKPDRLTSTAPKTTPAPSLSPSPSSEAPATASKSGGADDGIGATGPVTAREKAVVKGWADALRRGDVERAASYWEIPAVAANGGQPIKLLSRRAVFFWNVSLPCGAKLESVQRDSTYVLATFVLTERPGKGDCGTGVGHRARTLFLVHGHKIVQWLRAADPPQQESQKS
jgi:hypothetical protein